MTALVTFSAVLIGEIVTFLLICLSILGFGALAFSCIRQQKQFKIIEYLSAVALGLGILSHLMLGMAALHMLTPVFGWGLIFTGIICLLVFLANRKTYLGPLQVIIKKWLSKFTSWTASGSMDWISAVFWLLLFTALIYPLFANALTPPVDYDESAYHLAVPKIYLRDNALSYIPYIIEANWPFEMEMSYTLGLLIGSESTARLMTWLCFVLLVGAIYFAARDYWGGKSGLYASALFALTPMASKIAGTALAEISLALFFTLAVLWLIKGLEHDDDGSFMLSAVFGGLAASTKLNAALIPLVLGVFACLGAFLFRRKRHRTVLWLFLVYGLTSLLVVAPWYLKSWIQTGNPVYPFLYSVFGGANWDQIGVRSFLYIMHSTNVPINVRSWLSGLWTISFDQGRFGGFKLGISYLVLLPTCVPAILLTKEKRQKILFAFLGLLLTIFYTAWFFQAHQTRYLLPYTGVFAIWISFGVDWLLKTIPKPGQLILQIALIGLIVRSSLVFSAEGRTQVANSWHYLSGQWTREDYLTNYIPGFQMFTWINQELPEDAVIWMALWESRGYFLDRPYVWANPIGQRLLPLEKIKDSQELADALKEMGITHILFHRGNLYNFPYLFTDQLVDLIEGLLRAQATLLQSAGPLEVYLLNP